MNTLNAKPNTPKKTFTDTNANSFSDKLCVGAA